MADPRITKLIEALAMAVCQNEHDMLLTGEELRSCHAALAAARSLQAAAQAEQPADLHAAIMALPLPEGFMVHMSPDPEALPAIWYDEQDMRGHALAAAELVAASPQQPAQQAVRVPLTEDEIRAAVQGAGLMFTAPDVRVARAIEAAHGIALPPAAKQGEQT